MDWFNALKWFLTGNNAKEFKAVISEWKDLKDEYKNRTITQDLRISELERTVHELEKHEAECHRQLIQIRKDHRDLQEEMIFIKREKR